MNFLNIIKDIENFDPEIGERISPRRAAIKSITSFGSKVAVSALPFALGTLFKKAYGQSNTTVNEVLNFALTLEYLEAEFYTQGVTALSAQIPSAAAKTALEKIRDDENKHVAFLKNVLGSAAVSKSTFDFTGKGAFPQVFSDYGTFLAVAQAFEDTGVRAYKGQAPSLLGNQTVLTAALAIHSVEARHASHIRQMRKGLTNSPVPNLKPWITGSASSSNDSGVAAVDAVYAGENNKSQATVDITTLNGATAGSKISYSAAVEAFDEPLTKQQVLDIAGLFIVS